MRVDPAHSVTLPNARLAESADASGRERVLRPSILEGKNELYSDLFVSHLSYPLPILLRLYLYQCLQHGPSVRRFRDQLSHH